MATSGVHRKCRFLGQTAAKKVRKKEGGNSEKNLRRKLSETAAKMDARRSCVERRQGTLFSCAPTAEKQNDLMSSLPPATPPDGPGRLTTPCLNHGRKRTPRIKDVYISTELGADPPFLSICLYKAECPTLW